MDRNELYEFDPEQPFKLIAVTDKNGNDKVHTRELYEERINCIANNFHYEEHPYYDDKYRLHMEFIQNENGLWCKKGLHTSTIWGVKETDTGIIIVTRNSIYVFEKAELKEVPYQDESNLIELYMSLEDSFYFGKGFFYDVEKKPHELKAHIHLGMFQDSVLINFAETDNVQWCVCRYFPMYEYIEFYNTLYQQQEYATPMLIHNTGKKELSVRFQMQSRVWIIQPGKSKRIILATK